MSRNSLLVLVSLKSLKKYFCYQGSAKTCKVLFYLKGLSSFPPPFFGQLLMIFQSRRWKRLSSQNRKIKNLGCITNKQEIFVETTEPEKLITSNFCRVIISFPKCQYPDKTSLFQTCCTTTGMKNFSKKIVIQERPKQVQYSSRCVGPNPSLTLR